MRKDIFKEQERIELISILVLLPYVVAAVVMAFISGSLILIMDVFENSASLMQSGMAFGLSRKLQGNDSFKYDYGMGKIEAFGGFISTSFLYIGLLFTLFFSINTLVEPNKAGETWLWVILLTLISVAIDVYLYIKQLKITKSVDSSFVRSELAIIQKEIVVDLIGLITVSAVYFFRNFSFIGYVEPVICIVCIVYIAYMNAKNIKETVSDLLDKTLGETEQLKILKCVSMIFGSIKGFEGIRTRRSGHRIYIDLLVTFEDNNTYVDICRVMEQFDTAANEILPNSVTAVVISKFCDVQKIDEGDVI
jgi:divalent metal cation (Fe/Co/Zn/Cd) transporter